MASHRKFRPDGEVLETRSLLSGSTVLIGAAPGFVTGDMPEVRVLQRQQIVDQAKPTLLGGSLFNPDRTPKLLTHAPANPPGLLSLEAEPAATPPQNATQVLIQVPNRHEQPRTLVRQPVPIRERIPTLLANKPGNLGVTSSNVMHTHTSQTETHRFFDRFVNRDTEKRSY